MTKLEFKTVTVTGEKGGGIDVHAALIPETEGVLAVQLELCTEGHAYMGLHIPTGGKLSTCGFDRPDEARFCLTKFWNALNDSQKQVMRSGDPAVVQGDKSIERLLSKHICSEAAIHIIPAPEIVTLENAKAT